MDGIAFILCLLYDIISKFYNSINIRIILSYIKCKMKHKINQVDQT